MQSRDLIGYGPNPPAIEWPNKARIAVSLVVNYEEGSEYSTLDGDPAGETLGESPSPVPSGQRDLANESFFEYGSRVGIWRILNIFDRLNVPATFYCCAVALERNPFVGPAIVKYGHEVFGHGNRWEEYFKMSREEERKAIHQAVKSIKKTTGERPLGWYCRYGPSINTRELIIEEGGFIYDCNAYNDDLPFYTIVKQKDWLVVPYSLEVNDSKLWRGDMSQPKDWFETAKNTFDLLYEEGSTHPKMMSLGLHCRIIGKPSRAIELIRFIEYAKSKPGVWFAKRIEIARWWLEKYPPHPVTQP
ncbi:uncharacterized protein METZ01_LOCUS253170 [marine metagenome]|uniref:NodB homology domain-containing protein n=1 Tax=marine metagenome TaxID=408172 RepID=A0A382IL20_9ZZZZ